MDLHLFKQINYHASRYVFLFIDNIIVYYFIRKRRGYLSNPLISRIHPVVNLNKPRFRQFNSTNKNRCFKLLTEKVQTKSEIVYKFWATTGSLVPRVTQTRQHEVQNHNPNNQFLYYVNRQFQIVFKSKITTLSHSNPVCHSVTNHNSIKSWSKSIVSPNHIK